MPEVCEVALTSLYLNEYIMNNVIKDIKILGGRYSRKPMQSLPTLIKYLSTNPSITIVDSKGKQMWFQLKNSKGVYGYLLSHLGYEGRWSFKIEKHANIELILQSKTVTKNKWCHSSYRTIFWKSISHGRRF